MEDLNALVALYQFLARRRNNRRRRLMILMNINRLRGPYCRLRNVPIEIDEILMGNNNITKKHLRISFQSLQSLITLYPNKLKGWSKEYEIVVFLYWLACGTSYRIVATTFVLSRTTVFNIITRTLNETVQFAHQIIKLPRNEELQEIGQGFANLLHSFAFDYAVGAIDGCHVRITCPTALHDQYINRKLFYSIQIQAVCDHSGKFIDLFTGLPGSVHDARALRYSPIYRYGLYPENNNYLLGDSGYGNIVRPIAIITPYRHNNLTPQQVLFNNHHAMGRNIIERAFGMMKVRWRVIFTKAMELSIQKCIKTIVCCSVLHNICLTNGEILNNLNAEQRIYRQIQVQDQEPGNFFRDQILQRVVNERQ